MSSLPLTCHIVVISEEETEAQRTYRAWSGPQNYHLRPAHDHLPIPPVCSGDSSRDAAVYKIALMLVRTDAVCSEKQKERGSRHGNRRKGRGKEVGDKGWEKTGQWETHH